MNRVGGTYPERKLKPSDVPLFPEETIRRNEVVTLDLGKIYPSTDGKFVSSEQESPRLEDALLSKDESLNNPT